MLLHGVVPGCFGDQDMHCFEPLRVLVGELLDRFLEDLVGGVLLIGHNDVEVGEGEHPKSHADYQ
eukprot:4433677-Heterocapsa_arctica.AAC.1